MSVRSRYGGWSPPAKATVLTPPEPVLAVTIDTGESGPLIARRPEQLTVRGNVELPADDCAAAIAASWPSVDERMPLSVNWTSSHRKD